MIIASSFSMTLILVGIALITFGLFIIGWLLSVFVKRLQDMDDDNETWEKYTASDGKTYLWPKYEPRSSRNNKNNTIK